MMGLAVLHGAESENAWPVELALPAGRTRTLRSHFFEHDRWITVTDGYEIPKATLGRRPRATTRAPLCRAQSWDGMCVVLSHRL